MGRGQSRALYAAHLRARHGKLTEFPPIVMELALLQRKKREHAIQLECV